MYNCFIPLFLSFLQARTRKANCDSFQDRPSPFAHVNLFKDYTGVRSRVNDTVQEGQGQSDIGQNSTQQDNEKQEGHVMVICLNAIWYEENSPSQCNVYINGNIYLNSLHSELQIYVSIDLKFDTWPLTIWQTILRIEIMNLNLGHHMAEIIIDNWKKV